MTRREVKRKLKRQLGLSQEQVAEVLGVTSAFMCRYFKGKSKSERIDRELAKMIDVPFTDMPGRKSAMPMRSAS